MQPQVDVLGPVNGRKHHNGEHGEQYEPDPARLCSRRSFQAMRQHLSQSNVRTKVDG